MNLQDLKKKKPPELLAFAEELGSGYISSGYRDAMGFVIIILVLMFKPTGLFPVRGERIG